MNVDNNSDSNELLDAPEDDDFGDFEGAEDEAPEAVQAMVGGPNWVYPDLVRIQSSNSNTQNDSSDGRPATFNNNRTPHRVLDPPDVSLLTSNLNSSKPQNTLDLCSSLGSNNNKMIFNTNNHTAKNCINSGQTSVSSPSSGSSSSSLAATNMSGLILSNSSNSSSPSLSNNKHDNFQSNMICNNINPIPSTSNGITSGINQQLSQMEQRIRTLQEEKQLLQDQLEIQEREINRLNQVVLISENENNLFAKESISRRIENVLERIESNLETSINNLTNRVESLENKVNMTSLIYGDHGNHNISIEQYFQFLQELKTEQQQERREIVRILANILSHALQEINNTLQ